MQRIDLTDGWIIYYPEFLTESKGTHLIEYCLKNLPFDQGTIQLFGKKHVIPRLESFHSENGKSYGYSGKKLISHPFHKEIKEIKDQIESLSGHFFNSVLVNYYRTGQDSNGWHADNEKELGNNPVIASLSLGATRRFDLKHNQSSDQLSMELTHGSLLIMGGELQHHWKHRIPKQMKINEARINLTFRFID